MIEEIKKLYACPEALEWLRGQESPEEAWATCTRADWMLWLAMKKAGSPGWAPWQEVVLVLCDIVEPLVANLADPRSLAVIKACRAFVAGKISRSSLLDAKADAANAAYAAYADAYAAYAAYAAALAAIDATAALAAIDATQAAHAASSAASAKGASLADMADLVRERLTLGEL